MGSTRSLTTKRRSLRNFSYDPFDRLLSDSTHRGDQATGFEELTRQLVSAEALSNVEDIEHRGPGADGGVEVLVRFKDATSWGWQSKWFDGLGTSQIDQLKDSFKSALKNFGASDKGRLIKFVVALPLNISGPGTADTSDARKRWSRFKVWAAKESAKTLSRDVEIELWDETAFISRLQRHDGPYPGILAYWFDRLVFTPEWFRRHLKRFPAEVNRGIPKGQVGSEFMRIDSPLGGEPCAARIPVKCEYELLDLLKREHRGGKPPSSWRSAQVPQLDGCSTGKQSAFLGQNHAEEAFLRWSDMRSGYSLLSLSSRI